MSISPEEVELARLGYKQEFRREFSWISTFSFAFSISGLLGTVQFRLLSGMKAHKGVCHDDLWVSFNSWWSACSRVVLVFS